MLLFAPSHAMRPKNLFQAQRDGKLTIRKPNARKWLAGCPPVAPRGVRHRNRRLLLLAAGAGAPATAAGAGHRPDRLHRPRRAPSSLRSAPAFIPMALKPACAFDAERAFRFGTVRRVAPHPPKAALPDPFSSRLPALQALGA